MAVTLSSFQQRASTARKQSGALLIHVNPEVKTEEDRATWENFTVEHPDTAWMYVDACYYLFSLSIVLACTGPTF